MPDTADPFDSYLDAKTFPLTTQEGLDLESQMMIDAHNRGELQEMKASGKQLSDRQRARLAEYEQKAQLAGSGTTS